jgi:hypothetical protein
LPRGHEIHRDVGIGKIGIFPLASTSLHASLAVANIAERSLPTKEILHSDFKKFSAPLASGSNFLQSVIANGCPMLRGIFKGLSQDWGRADFSKNLRASICYKEPVERTLFWPDPSRAGQYFKWIHYSRITYRDLII